MLSGRWLSPTSAKVSCKALGDVDPCAEPDALGWLFVHVSLHHELRNWYFGNWFGFCEQTEAQIS